MKVLPTANPYIEPFSPVTIKETGHITELRYVKRTPRNHILKIDKNSYLCPNTGEVKEYKKHSENRSENTRGVKRSLKSLRDLINTNVIDTKKCLWATLTYAENMQNTEQLYTDFKKFIMRLRYHLEKFPKPPSLEYIVAMEPQGRGAWHAHVIFIFNPKAPFIPNDILNNLWGHGFVKITALKDVDNVGAYLTAYLGDMELSETNILKVDPSTIKTIDKIDSKGEKSEKYYVKGARLNLYPTGFRLFRKSKGIKNPTVTKTTFQDAKKLIGAKKLTYERSIRLEDDEGREINLINYRYYR